MCQNGCAVSDDGFIVLTNSVNLADAPRLSEAGVMQGGGGRLEKVLRGKLLLCKVFMGQTAKTQSHQE